MRKRHVRIPLLAVLALVLGLLAIPAASAQRASGDESAVTNTYIVRLADPPLASYRGGIAGLAPTNPAALGQTKLDVDSPASLAYLAHLDAQHQAFLAAAASRV